MSFPHFDEINKEFGLIWKLFRGKPSNKSKDKMGIIENTKHEYSTFSQFFSPNQCYSHHQHSHSRWWIGKEEEFINKDLVETDALGKQSSLH